VNKIQAVSLNQPEGKPNREPGVKQRRAENGKLSRLTASNSWAKKREQGRNVETLEIAV